MQVLGAISTPFGAREDFDGCHARVLLGEAIIKVDGMVDRQSPKVRIGHFGPTDAGVEHHGACHGSNDTDSAFSGSIGVMSTGSSKDRMLAKFTEISEVISTGEARSTVGDILSDDVTVIAHPLFVLVLVEESFVARQVNLETTVDRAGGSIVPDGSALVASMSGTFAKATLKSARSAADEVVDEHSLSGNKNILHQASFRVRSLLLGYARFGSACLLAELA